MRQLNKKYIAGTLKKYSNKIKFNLYIKVINYSLVNFVYYNNTIII